MADAYGKAKSGGADKMDLVDTYGKAGWCGRIWVYNTVMLICSIVK